MEDFSALISLDMGKAISVSSLDKETIFISIQLIGGSAYASVPKKQAIMLSEAILKALDTYNSK